MGFSLVSPQTKLHFGPGKFHALEIVLSIQHVGGELLAYDWQLNTGFRRHWTQLNEMPI
jgi:hypothetical protein